MQDRFFPHRSAPSPRTRPSAFRLALSLALIALIFGFAGGLAGEKASLLFSGEEPREEVPPASSHEEAVVRVAEESFPAVVSIVISKDVPVLERVLRDPFEDLFPEGSPFRFRIPEYQERGTERRDVGGGTGFFVSRDGFVLTNKHVVIDETAEYTVFTNDGRRFEARVLARHPTQDLAILQTGSILPMDFPVLPLGDSDALRPGQTVIAIGNVLGEFRNSVSVGVISGLGRSVTASGGGFVQALDNVIQTDAAINRGNSGGPLLNLQGEVVGMNTAMVLRAQNIGFAVPINQAKESIEQVRSEGRIIVPFLGVRYLMVTEELQKERDLPFSYGALIIGGDEGEPSVVEGSPAHDAGLREGDLILEFEGTRLDEEYPLWKAIGEYDAGETVELKVWREGEELSITVELGERPEGM